MPPEKEGSPAENGALYGLGCAGCCVTVLLDGTFTMIGGPEPIRQEYVSLLRSADRVDVLVLRRG